MQATQFQQFTQAVANSLPHEIMITEYSKRYAYGTDASFYRLTPELVLNIDNAQQLKTVLELANRYNVAITFRAAGTSLSGQAVTDSVLITLTENWTGHNILEQGDKITLQPGIIGAKANQLLKPYLRKIGPDPASINSCKLGGIAANNASGMCCGVKQNSYHTLSDMTIILADGTELNTACQQSCNDFLLSHQDLTKQLMALAKEVHSNTALKEKIQHKYRLKNTTGYGINALIDFNEPIDIIKHLMIGSEGTLGFIADITLHTVADNPYKSTGFFIFNKASIACQLVEKLAKLDVDALELLDKRALLSVAEHNIMPKGIESLPADSVALLIEVHAAEPNLLTDKVALVSAQVAQYADSISAQLDFANDSERNQALWNIRKGTFPAVGAMREMGTTVIIEDVAFPLVHLAEGIAELQKLFVKYGYHEAIIFGHALVGNLHFVFTQAFDSPEKISRYDDFMTDVANLVAVQLKGSLKAEHGTGRNMAPFVELEWGKDAYQLMKALKKLFDKNNILNPGVIINDDKKAHIKHLKEMPIANDIIDKCIECGFCESVCPSQGLTFTPRQRIAVWRRIVQLKQLISQHEGSAETSDKLYRLKQEYQDLSNDYQYLAVDSCAATGLCGMDCPVGINTGDFIKALRKEGFNQSPIKKMIANTCANNFSVVTRAATTGLSLVDKSKRILGDKIVTSGFKVMNKLSGSRVPLYFSSWPKGERKLATGLFKSSVPIAIDYLEALSEEEKSRKQNNTVVYMPACAGRIFAPNEGHHGKSLAQVVISVLNKAGFDVLVPEQSQSLCCGMAFSSKGDEKNAKSKSTQSFQTLLKVSDGGRLPIMMDASSCALHLNQQDYSQTGNSIKVYESAEFINQFILARLEIAPKKQPILLHVTCSSKRGHIDKQLVSVAKHCAEQVTIPADVSCCAFAGDKGFFQPELNKHALRHLKKQKPHDCQQGYSNNRSCEIGLSEHGGISYQSIFYLLDEVSKPKGNIGSSL